LDWVSKIIEQLPEQQKIILQLRDIEQYDFEEIAEMLDMNQTAIRVALSRARKTIREQLTNTHSYGIK
jgi:RNA polymerase sigma-70 factor (ECF subfamily)